LHTKPSAILHALDDALAQILRIDQSDLQQGMDMGMVVIDRAEHKLHYSGAVHNLVYIKNGVRHEVKASRCSIGGLVPIEEKVYETSTIPVTDQMYCYLASDGLPTQLGGSQGKKFGSYRLKDLFQEVNSLTASSKKAAIEKAADDWIGTEYRQLDDILVLGFRPDLAI
jgi:serine phosphatase RsbU (regulator of sigma subunit)